MRIVLGITIAGAVVLGGCTSMKRNNSGQLNEQGVQYLSSNDLPKAHAQFVEAWKQDPSNADTLYNLASTYHRRGQMQEAERYYRQALQLQPEHQACRHNYYMLLVSQNRTTEARVDAERWLKQQPRSADAETNVGWLMRLQGDLPEAKKHLEMALSLEPHNTGALLEMGKLYQDYEMPDRARGLYRRVLQQDPGNKDATALLAGLGTK